MLLRYALITLGLSLVACSSSRCGSGSSDADDPPTVRPGTPAGHTAMCMGEAHTCFVQPGTGRVLCAGKNLDGQLGDGTGESRETFVEATRARGATSLSCGAAFTCAVVEGHVRCFGRNHGGQLGRLTTSAGDAPEEVPGITDAVEVDAGDDFACARRRDGRVSCWGNADLGAFGPDAHGFVAPHVISGITGATELATGNHHTCARVANGEVVCFGDNDGGQLGRPRGAPLTAGMVLGITNVSALALGGDSSCVVIAGRVTCFGGGSHVREIPVGAHAGHDHEGHDHPPGEAPADEAPAARPPTGSPREVPALAHVAELVVSRGHACARLEDATVRCWGDGAFGKLGTGTSLSSTLPTDVMGVVDAVAIAAGTSTTCVLRRGGALACFGSNVEGQMGFGELRAHESAVDVVRDVRTVRPAAVAAPTRSVAMRAPSTPSIDAGDVHACFLGANGRVHCWGGNGQGQLGDGTSVARGAPTEVLDLTNAVEIAAAPSFTCARRADGTVVCWGSSEGGLGTGRPSSSSRPVVVEGVRDAIGIGVGRRFVCVVHTNKGVSCFGAGTYGALGNGSYDDATHPVRIEGLTGVVEVRAGSAFACARHETGKVSCWGSNGEGTLGDGTTDPRSTPAPVVGLADAIDLDAYDTNVCAVRRNGRVVCWGDRRYGAIGDERAERGPVSRPTEVVGVENAVEVTVGTSSACARTAAGATFCWGGNLFGQAGVGDGNLREIVRAVPIFTDAPEVAALGARTGLACGRHFCCALHGTNRVSCAGQSPVVALGDQGALSGPTSLVPRVVAAPRP